tara:strand:+ start:894 stop:1199 length:306 start_codon:yes stop_codon:yes gene_type:complete
MINKDILKGAPDRATHWDFNEYMRWDSNYDWEFYNDDTKKWECTCDVENNIRALADIKRIVALENTLQKLLDATSEIYCNSNDLGLAEGKASELLKEADND